MGIFDLNNNSNPPELSFPLTKEFLNLTFNREVACFTAKIGTNPGDNMLSLIYTIKVSFEGNDETPNQYLIKCYPVESSSRAYLDVVKVFEKELFLYEEFFPQLQKLARDSGGDNLVLSIAPFHGGNAPAVPSKIYKTEPWSNESFILMTDLRDKYGCKMKDRREGLDLPHGILVMKEIAKLHALSWAYKLKHGLPLLTKKYPCLKDHLHPAKPSPKKSQRRHQYYSEILEVVGDTIGKSHPAYLGLDKVLDSKYEIMNSFVAEEGIDESRVESYLRIKQESNLDVVESHPWLVGTHGDCGVNNFLFQYNPEIPSKPEKVALVDFQICREVCPTLDLAFFFSCSMRAFSRRLHKPTLVQVYHDAFLQICDTLKVEPLPGFTLPALQRRLRRSELYGLIIAMGVLPTALKPQPQRQVSKDQEGFSLFQNPLFKEEYTACVLDAYENGII